MSYADMVQVLKKQLSPAFGCTEPASLAYAGSLLGKRINGSACYIKLVVDKKLYKNSLRVTIPGTKMKGPLYAFALGLSGGEPEYKLEALRHLNEEVLSEAERLVSSGIIDLDVKPVDSFFIEAEIKTEGDQAKCRLEGAHSRVTLLEVNAERISIPTDASCLTDDTITTYNLDQILDFARNVPAEALSFLEEGLQMNYEMAKEGLLKPSINYFGAALVADIDKNTLPDNIAAYARALAAAACDARMDGWDQSAMALAGSGNQGITAMVPVAAVSEALKLSKEFTLRALALSQLITCYIKAKIGLLTAVCGCAIAAGAGVSAAVVFLSGGSNAQIKAAVNCLIGGLAGMICDGAKGGCAFKIYIATGAAFDAAQLSLQGISILPADGIVDEDVEITINNLVEVATEGMDKVDETIVKIMNTN